jgi:tripartite-type tricarboxylate transporter receptor subunit TctC
VPAAMVEKLSGLTRKALEADAVKKAFEQQGATSIWMNPADTAAFRLAEEKRLAPIIRASGAKVE